MSKQTSDHNLLKYIGNTPLIRLKRVIPKGISEAVEFYAKAEWFNPGGSVKDRAAYRMVRDALDKGTFRTGQTLIDSTSGNTGIAYAMIGAVMGFPVELVMPKNVSIERRKIVEAYGTKIHFSDPLKGSDGARQRVREIVDANPARYFFPDQYNNPSNWRAHYETTGPEIWRDTQGRVTHFVAGMGTSGTMMGTARFLKEKNPALKAVALQPDSFYGIEGWKNMASSAEPVGIFDPTVPGLTILVPTEAAYELSRELAAKEGLLVSPSAGGALYGALQAVKDVEQAVVVMIFADGADRYLSMT